VAGVATTICAGEEGRLSVKFAPLMVTEEVLLKVNVSVDVPLATVEVGEKAFEISTDDVGSIMYAKRVEIP
jgi:hypothetical protein